MYIIYIHIFFPLQPFLAQVFIAMATPPQLGRKSGTTADNFEVDFMVEQLEPYARLKDCPFDWELAHYAKSRRTQSADRDGLMLYHILLAIVLTLAPFGYPSLGLLKIVWGELQRKFKIMSRELTAVYDGKLDSWASLCCERVRLACRHVVDLKRSKTTWVGKEVKSLLDLVHLRDVQSPDVLPPAVPIATRRSIAKIPSSPGASSSSVICCSFKCQCDDCKLAPSVVSCDSKDEGNESSCDSAERAALANTEFVPAQRGGQKRAARAEGDDDKEDAKPVKRRPAAAKKKPATAEPEEKPAAQDKPMSLKIVMRNNPVEKRESYIMMDGKFLLSCRETASAAYKTIIEKLAEEIRDGTCAGDKKICLERLTALKLSHLP
jgi:hypothetical protein